LKAKPEVTKAIITRWNRRRTSI